MRGVESAGCCDYHISVTLGPLTVSGHDISLVRFKNGHCNNIGCVSYCVRLDRDASAERSGSWRTVIRRDLAGRMFIRFLLSQRQLSLRAGQSSISSTAISTQGQSRKAACAMPGCENPQFLEELGKAVKRKFENRFHPSARTVKPTLFFVAFFLWHLN